MRNSNALTSPARRAAACGALLAAALLAAVACARPARGQESGGAAGTVGAAAAARRPAGEGARQGVAATGSISGRVVGDGGESLPGVAVFVRPRGSGPARQFPQHTSDEEGNFVVKGLAPGAYHVSAHAPGYVLDPEQLNAAAAGGAHRLGDFVTVRLLRGGVITGAVSDAAGEPLVALRVRVFRVRDHDGRPASALWNFVSEDQTDDRGVYRVYALPPGGYVVAAGGGLNQWGPALPYASDAPTFYPGGTRDTATEITVRAGQEVAGIDIRHREERGYRVTGTLTNAPPANDDTGYGVGVVLTYAGSGVTAASAWVSTREAERVFSLEGVADGDYEVQAQVQTNDGAGSSSAPQRVTVRGADVTGLKLALVPLASAGGTLVAEPAPEALRALGDCKGRAAAALPQETLVLARRDLRAVAPARGAQGREAAPDEAGAFTLRNLEAGAYRFEARPLDGNFYVRSVELPPAAPSAARPGAPTAPGRAPAAASTNLFHVGPGQQLSGLEVRLAAGAAAAAGRVVAADAGTPLPPFHTLRVYLLPAERERADDVLRYAEATPAADGSFAFRNLAPGRYLSVVRATDAKDAPPRPAFWDADGRARLRREAEAANLTLDLQPCQRADDLAPRYPQPPNK